MRQTNTKLLAEQKPLGVIDAVSVGLELVRKRPWTLSVPILFDLLLWLPPRLSLTFLRPYAQEMVNAASFSTDPVAAQETRRALMQLIESFNLLGLIAAALNSVARVPSLLAVDAAEVRSPIHTWAYTLPLQSPAFFVLLSIPLFLLGLFAVAVYLEWIAQGVRPLNEPIPGAWLARVGRLWLRLMLFALLLAGFALAGGLGLLSTPALTGSPEASAALTLFVMVGLVWLFVYFFFVPSMLAVSDIGLREALRRSMLLFRVYFWATTGLVALSVFLDRGLALIWDGLTVSAPGVAIGIAANAYIGTSLIAASMVFYQDRLNWFERMRAKAKPIRR